MSGGRITRESEHYILHELPWVRAVCYLHSHWWRREGVWTTGIDSAVSGEVAAKVDRILEKVLASQA